MRITLDSKFPSAVTGVTFDRDVNVGVPCQNMLLRLLARVRCKGKMIPNSQVVMKIKLKSTGKAMSLYWDELEAHTTHRGYAGNGPLSLHFLGQLP